MESPPTYCIKRRGRKPKQAFLPAASPAELELWAMLCNTDGLKVAAAKTTLDRDSRTGVRHFSAIRRAVPLQRTHEVLKEIDAMDRAIGPDEIFSNNVPRKWIRKVVDV